MTYNMDPETRDDRMGRRPEATFSTLVNGQEEYDG